MADHHDIEQLIPWYVNGTLNEAEMDLVNQHLGSCSSCTQSVEAEVFFARKLRAEPGGIRQLPHADAAWTDFTVRLPRRHPPTRSVPVAALLSLTLIIASASFLAGQHLQRPLFETMTTPQTHDGTVVQVMFEPGVPEHAIRRVVLESGGIVIAGPTATGIYRIVLSAGDNGSATVAHLRGLPGVLWVSLEGP